MSASSTRSLSRRSRRGTPFSRMTRGTLSMILSTACERCLRSERAMSIPTMVTMRMSVLGRELFWSWEASDRPDVLRCEVDGDACRLLGGGQCEDEHMTLRAGFHAQRFGGDGAYLDRPEILGAEKQAELPVFGRAGGDVNVERGGIVKV